MRNDHDRSSPPPGDAARVRGRPAMYRHLADAQVNVELDTGDMVLNIGPQHPATHGTLRLVVRLDGERVVAADPIIGYMHRGYEKLTEYRTYPQITTLINRIDWLSSFANEVPFIHAAEQLMGIEAPPRAQYIRTVAHRAVAHRDVPVVPRRDGPAGRRDHARVLRLPRPRVRPQPDRGASTGGRFHPNFNRIGGIKDDLPWGWIADCRQRCSKVLESCDQFEDLVAGNPIFEAAHPLDRHHPRRARCRVRRLAARTCAASGVDWDLRRDGAPYLVVQRARLEGLDAPRRRLVRALLGAAAGDARVGAHGVAAPRRSAERPDHGEGAAHHQGARGRSRGSTPRTRSARWATTSSRRARPARSA